MSTAEPGFVWRSQSVFIVVAVGATLSLNDFLTFPELTRQNGGGAFLLLYVLFLMLLGLPLLMAELMLGRATRADPSAGIRMLSERYKASVYWKLGGLAAMLAAFLIVATLTVIAGWSLAYTVKSAAGLFQGADLESARAMFDHLIVDAERMTLWHTLFAIALVAVAAQPQRQGLERIYMILVPMMILLLAMALVAALSLPGFVDAIRQMLYVDLAAVDSHTPILALQRAFYTLALGLGIMLAFGRYLPEDLPIGYTAGLIIAADVLFSIFTGISINAFLLTVDMQPGTGSQFAFRVMPVVFEYLGTNQLFGTAFYLLMTIAALTTSIALLEAPLTYLQRKLDISRQRSAIYLTVCVWSCGLGVILGQSIWNGEGFTLALFVGDKALRLVNNAGFHDVLIFVSSHLLQPLVAFIVCLFAAWIIPREASHQALALRRHYCFEIWNYMIRYIVPVMLLVVFLAALGIV